MAMSFLETGPLPPNADFRILASDIDPKVVSFGRQGRYHERMLNGLPEPMRKDHFTQDPTDPDHFLVSPALKSLVVFRELNLLHQWPMRGKFDVIFCRNVVIYFDAETQTRLWRKFAQAMQPDAWLFLGHSERVCENCSSLFINQGVTAYQRNDAALTPSSPHACP